MKIGIITFHWVTNYGAVLQAYALQSFLIGKNFDAEIINYVPYRVKYRQILSSIKRRNLKDLIKEYRINKFRKNNLFLSKHKFLTNKKLYSISDYYDAVICGSDQIWNEWFLLKSEKQHNLSYYLNFVKAGKVKLSYAASFGTDKLTDNIEKIVKPALMEFNHISVRENTGKKIVEDLGFSAQVAVDPTLLIEREVYERKIQDIKHEDDYQLFSYILHHNQNEANEVVNYIFDTYFNSKIEKKYDGEPIDIERWLYSIKNAKFVVTNSFHGTIFSLIFHTPFIVIPVEGSGMNDRINTLLNIVSLGDRIIKDFDKDRIDNLIKKEINWDSLDSKIKSFKKGSEEFLIDVLTQ